jgi:hypothetical protein
VKRDLQRTRLPNGREYCAELAETERAQDYCMGDLEDALKASNDDKTRAWVTLDRGINRIKAGRVECSWWQVSCKRDKTRLQAGEDAPNR